MCLACGLPHHCVVVCRELRDAWWALVKDQTDGDAYRWARRRLSLDDEPATAPARSAPTGHYHGWASVDGRWLCVQDYYAVGRALEAGRGATWEPTR